MSDWLHSALNDPLLMQRQRQVMLKKSTVKNAIKGMQKDLDRKEDQLITHGNVEYEQWEQRQIAQGNLMSDSAIKNTIKVLQQMDQQHEEAKGKKPDHSKGSGRKPKAHTGRSSYSMYLHRVLMQVHPDFTISKRAMTIVDSCIHDLFERIASEAGRLANLKGMGKGHGKGKGQAKHTLTARDIQAATKLLLGGKNGSDFKLTTFAIRDGTNATVRYTINSEK